MFIFWPRSLFLREICRLLCLAEMPFQTIRFTEYFCYVSLWLGALSLSYFSSHVGAEIDILISRWFNAGLKKY